MSFLEAAIIGEKDQEMREQLQERMDIVQHKIKFMEKVPVAYLDAENRFSDVLLPIIEAAGGEKADPENARVLIYWQAGTEIPQLMSKVPGLLSPEWPAVTFSRVYLWNGQSIATADAAQLVSMLEDLSEMLYPGFFVFGNEGNTWTAFKTK
jgi:iron complex transport system substrate-binding protein